MKKSLILYGAYDRYNYGDNLMPILLEKYLEKEQPEVLEKMDLVYASISASDLTKYKCKKTVSINNLLETTNKDSAVIVVGGEVLNASITGLFWHVQKNTATTFLLKVTRKILPALFSFLVGKMYRSPWEYPYIPDPQSFNKKVKVAYNAVGGVQKNNSSEVVLKNLRKSVFFSVRDERTYNSFASSIDTSLAPDSVLLISALVNDNDFENNVRAQVINKTSCDYIVVQACPWKIEKQQKLISEQLRKISDSHNIKIILLPIGYASGHDDVVFSKQIKKLMPENSEIMYELNVWEIMYVIKQAKIFYGTSLHGVITAMAFNVPHFGINPRIKKLDSFLNTWSVAPFNNCIEYGEIYSSYKNNYDSSLNKLNEKVKNAQTKVIKNNVKLFSRIIC